MFLYKYITLSGSEPLTKKCFIISQKINQWTETAFVQSTCLIKVWSHDFFHWNMEPSNINWLVVSTPLNMKVSWDYCSQYMEKEKPCSKPPTSKWSNLIWDPQPTDRSSFGATGKGGKGGKGRGACLRSGPVKGTKPQFGGWKVISIETPFLHFLWLKIKYIKCMNKTINQNSVTSLFALNFWFRCSDWCHANVVEGYIWKNWRLLTES